jgi:hypothetical protein
MKNPFHKIFSRLRNNVYYQEMVQISSVSAIGLFAFIFVKYGETAWKLATTPTGIIWVLAFLAGLVLALTILLFFNMLIVKYSDKPEQYALLSKK